MENSKIKTVGEFVANDYRTATVFQQHGIDFCCRGGKTIEEVSRDKNIPADQLLEELAAVGYQSDNQSTDFQSWPLDLLTDYIEKKHHRYIEETTPVLRQFLDKLCSVHGGNHPELLDITEQFNASAGELAVHMKKEEFILFPYVRKMVASKTQDQKAAEPGFGTVQNPIRMMMQEHDIEGERFRRISALSNQYQPPADGCRTYQVTFALLKEFENDLHMHIHLENNILFPKSIEMEAASN